MSELSRRPLAKEGLTSMPVQRLTVMCECGHVMQSSVGRYFQCICNKRYVVVGMGEDKQLYRCITTRAKLEINGRRVQDECGRRT